MPKVNRTAQEETHNSPIAEVVEQSIGTISVSTVPVLICGVNRKTNIGNFENIDIYAGLSIPLPNTSVENVEELKQAIEEAAKIGFNITSTETYARYSLIKEGQATKRD